MQYHITIDKKNEEKIRTLNAKYRKREYISSGVTIILKQIYYMCSHRLFEHTSLPTDVINIIWDYNNEEILIHIEMSEFNNIYDEIGIHILPACANYDYTVFSYRRRDEQCYKCINFDGILKTDCQTDIFTLNKQKQVFAYEIIKQTIYNCINFYTVPNRRVFYKYDGANWHKFIIINHDLMLLYCNIIHLIGKYIQEFDFSAHTIKYKKKLKSATV